MFVSKKKMREIMSQADCSLDSELSARLLANVYRLPDGKVMIQDENRGVIWNSREELLAILNRPRRKPTHVLTKYLDAFRSKESFLSLKRTLSEMITKHLGIMSGQLDYSFNSLLLIDKKKKRLKTEQKEELFPHLVLYVGEVYKKEWGGDWVFVFVEEPGVFEPWFPNEEPLFLEVFKCLFEPKYKKRSLMNCLSSASCPQRTRNDSLLQPPSS